MLELGGGLTGRINANISVFANVDYEFEVGVGEGDKRNGVRGAFGSIYVVSCAFRTRRHSRQFDPFAASSGNDRFLREAATGESMPIGF